MQALLRLVHGADLRSIDGAGGDGGRDAVITTHSDGTAVFEVKSYTERLNGSQRRKIKSSLTTAIATEQKLDRWILVIPKNPTPAEEAWFRDLQAEYPKLKLEWWGLDWLDGQMARRNEFQRYIEGTDAQLLQRATDMSMEQAVFAHGHADIAARVRALKERVDEISPFWTVDIHTSARAQTHVLRAKHPDSANLDPITIRPEFTFDNEADSQHLRAQLAEVLDYGGETEIPGRYVSDFHVDASPEVKRLIEPPSGRAHSVTIGTTKEPVTPPVIGACLVVDDSDNIVARVPLRFTHRTRGQRGVRLIASDVGDFLQLAITLTGDPGSTGKMTFTLPDPAGRTSSALLELLEPIVELTPTRRIDIVIGQTVAMHGDPGNYQGFGEHARGLFELAQSMRRLERHTGSTLTVPRDLTDHDVAMLNGMAAALDAAEPVPTTFDTYRVDILPGRVDDFLESEESRVGAAIAVVIPAAQIGIHPAAEYGPLAMWAPTMHLINRRELEEADAQNPPTAVFRRGDKPIYWLPRQHAEQLTETDDPTNSAGDKAP